MAATVTITPITTKPNPSFNSVNPHLSRRKPRIPFDFVVVDDAQDMSIAQLRWVAALAADRPNALFFAGDPGQRTIQQPFSWRALGVDVSSRSSTLRINYRTSQQILALIGRLLGPQVSDVDGNTDDRSEEQLPRALAVAESVGLPTNVLDEHLFVAEDHVSIAPMPLAKGLEFRASRRHRLRRFHH